MISPDSIVIILESMPTYGLAMKIVWSFCIKGFIGSTAHHRLQLFFAKKISTNNVDGYKLSGKWHCLDCLPVRFKFSDGTFTDKWIRYGKRWIDHAPWKIDYYRNGKIKTKEIRGKNEIFNISYYPDGKILFKTWMNRIGLCNIYYYNNGQVKQKFYQDKNKNLTHQIFFYQNGQLSSMKWYKNNILHRRNGPASISWYEDGKLEELIYMYHGYDTDRIVWREDGSLEYEIHYRENTFYENTFRKNGNLKWQKLKGITLIYWKNGKLKCEKWKNENDRLSKEDGPAVVHYDKNGKITKEEWWWNGKRWNTPLQPAVIRYC